MIYTDGFHLVTNNADLEELHRFAQAMGLRRDWFQEKGRSHPHYDLTTQRASARAIGSGAKLVTPRELVKILSARKA